MPSHSEATDLCLIDPAPPHADQLSSLLLWQPGHYCPALAIEVVSHNHPYKDYGSIQDKYADLGVGELWVIDPAAFEMSSTERHAITLWQSVEQAFERSYAGSGPVRSPYLGAWLQLDANQLVVSDDRASFSRWLTSEQDKEVLLEQERAARQREQVAAQARMTQLQEQLQRLEQEKARR